MKHENMGSPNFIQQKAEECFSSAIKHGVSVKFHILRDVGKPEADNHSRFLISIKGALQFDRGFDEETEPRLRKVGAIDPPMHDKLCRQYLEGDLPFELVQTLHFPKNC